MIYNSDVHSITCSFEFLSSHKLPFFPEAKEEKDSKSQESKAVNVNEFWKEIDLSKADLEQRKLELKNVKLQNENPILFALHTILKNLCIENEELILEEKIYKFKKSQNSILYKIQEFVKNIFEKIKQYIHLFFYRNISSSVSDNEFQLDILNCQQSFKGHKHLRLKKLDTNESLDFLITFIELGEKSVVFNKSPIFKLSKKDCIKLESPLFLPDQAKDIVDSELPPPPYSQHSLSLSYERKDDELSLLLDEYKILEQEEEEYDDNIEELNIDLESQKTCFTQLSYYASKFEAEIR